MPRNPEDYAKLLGEKMERHGTDVYLVNTGWSGGPYGEGKRMDIALTRLLVDAAIGGKLKDAPYHEDKLFHVHVPDKVAGVPDDVLVPRNTWKDGGAYDDRAAKLSGEFAAHFDKVYGSKGIDPKVAAACPGK
jgi:phosphoenolpyruvate carboxykinase (ATP)